MNRIPATTTDIHTLCLVKGDERYVWHYRADQKSEVLRHLGQYASRSDLSFTWYDAALLSQKIRQEAK